MLKVTFVLNSSVLFKASNARLVQKHKRFITTIYLFLRNLTKDFQSTSCAGVNVKSSMRSKMMVLMRSPFHYKTSKTLLSQPKQTFYLSVIVYNNVHHPFIDSNLIAQLTKDLNKSNTLVIQKIKISHVLC